jgi:hypothetical protein
VDQGICRKGPRTLHADQFAVDSMTGPADRFVVLFSPRERFIIQCPDQCGVIDTGDLGKDDRAGTGRDGGRLRQGKRSERERKQRGSKPRRAEKVFGA